MLRGIPMKKTRLIIVMPLVLLFVSSCATMFKTKDEPALQKEPPVTRENANSYYDFNDIMVPNAMKLMPKESILFETAQIKAGVISFEGRVDPVSLFDFFVTSMANDGWKLRSYFKYGRYMLIFEKMDKDCVIKITSKTLSADLELWVMPRSLN